MPPHSSHPRRLRRVPRLPFPAAAGPPGCRAVTRSPVACSVVVYALHDGLPLATSSPPRSRRGRSPRLCFCGYSERGRSHEVNALGAPELVRQLRDARAAVQRRHCFVSVTLLTLWPHDYHLRTTKWLLWLQTSHPHRQAGLGEGGVIFRGLIVLSDKKTFSERLLLVTPGSVLGHVPAPRPVTDKHTILSQVQINHDSLRGASGRGRLPGIMRSVPRNRTRPGSVSRRMRVGKEGGSPTAGERLLESLVAPRSLSLLSPSPVFAPC